MKIYLDIDGVILANETHTANFAYEFLTYVTTRFPTYWLTAHCRGNLAETQEFLKLKLPPATFEVTKQILPTNWLENKTEAIDYSEPFLWFDDNLFDAERADLVSHQVLENWIEVDLLKDANQLQKFLSSFPIPINLVKTD